MKISVKKIMAICFVACTPTVFAQIPVTVTSDIPSTLNQIQTMAQWANQYQQMISQISQMKQQYAALTGSRGLGQILNNPASRSYLPDEWAGVYDQVRNG